MILLLNLPVQVAIILLPNLPVRSRFPRSAFSVHTSHFNLIDRSFGDFGDVEGDAEGG